MTLQSTDGKTGHGTCRPAVSVIIPARDAEALLARALESVHAQDYGGPLEVILADGSETAATRQLIRQRFPWVRVVANPERTIPAGLNRALQTARHAVIARCDARVVLPPDYLTRAVDTLLRTGAANVGGRLVPVGCTPFERAVALATSTPLAAGDARYRIGGAEGPVDTVFPGVFRYEALQAVGGFDETLLRNEDYELNWRLREGGETVWFDPRLILEYRPRGSLRALARQYFEYGRWKRVMLARHPRSMAVAPTGSAGAAGGAGRVGAAGRCRGRDRGRRSARRGAAGLRTVPAGRRCRDRRAPPAHRGRAGAGGGGHHPRLLGARLLRGR